MRKLLNTLYVTTPNAYLSKDGNNIVISADGETLFRIPCMNVESIISFGYQGASPGLMKLCCDNKIALNFYTPQGRFISRIQGKVSGNVVLRKKHYTLADDHDFSLELSRVMILGKMYNSRAVLRRYIRDYQSGVNVESVEKSCIRIKYIYSNLSPKDFDSLRGSEGEVAELYFKEFPCLILNKEKAFKFSSRSRRPPTDPINAMLSMGYSLLANDCASALEGVGLDPAVGFMHTIRPGRNSLALDLMEEMRAYLVDRFVISIINNKQISASDFQIHAQSSDSLKSPVLFTEPGLKKFLSLWQSKKKGEITHPFLNEKIPVGLLPHVQALLLARYLRGDLDGYPVFLIK